MPCVGVAEGAKSLVVATDERRASVHAGRGFHQVAVELKTERHHGFGFVDVGRREQFASDGAEYLSCGGENGLIVLPPPGNIQQTKQYSFRTYTQGVIEITGDSHSVGGGGNLRAVNPRELGRDRLRGWWRLGHTGMEQSAHSNAGLNLKLAQEPTAGQIHYWPYLSPRYLPISDSS